MEKKVNIQEIGYGIVVTGEIDLKTAENIIYSGKWYSVVDISQATFIIDEEEWQRCLGWSHCGPVYAKGGTRKVEVLSRFLELVKADKVIVPANIARRHMNAAIRNKGLSEIEVPEDCKLFAMKDGNVYNKKLTKMVFRRKHPTDIGTYKQRIKEIVDKVRPRFEILGMYAFQGVGDPTEVARCFVAAFEAYQEAIDYTLVTGFGEEDDFDKMDYLQMEAVYTVAKEQGFLPPLMLEQVGGFTMKMNGFFIQAQQR